MANSPRVAMTALLHRLVLDCFGIRSSGNALQARVSEVHLSVLAPDLGDSNPAQAIDERHSAWRADIPLDDGDDRLWDWLHALDEASGQALLAHCLSFGVNALYERPNPYGGNGISQHGLDRRMREADRLARMTSLDLVETGWKPTVANYLGRVTKARILEAVREGVGEQAVELIGHLKKGEMATEAERLLAGRGWLPEPLRMEAQGAVTDAAEASSSEADALPDFLTGDGEDDEPLEDEEQMPAQSIAAE